MIWNFQGAVKITDAARASDFRKGLFTEENHAHNLRECKEFVSILLVFAEPRTGSFSSEYCLELQLVFDL